MVLSLDVQFIYSFSQQMQLTKLLHTRITKLLYIEAVRSWSVVSILERQWLVIVHCKSYFLKILS